MERLPTKNSSYNNKEYWDSRFYSEEEYDWLGSYEQYQRHLDDLLHPSDQILMIGKFKLIEYKK